MAPQEPDTVTSTEDDDGIDPTGVSSYVPTGTHTEETGAGEGSAGDPDREAEQPPDPAEPGEGAPPAGATS